MDLCFFCVCFAPNFITAVMILLQGWICCAFSYLT